MCLKKLISAVQHDPLHGLRILSKNYHDEKLAITILIVGAGLIAYHFW